VQRLGVLSNVKVSPHILRHFFGVELIDRGENIRRVAELMGDSDMNEHHDALYGRQGKI
jgi:integrase/recombinase XerC